MREDHSLHSKFYRLDEHSSSLIEQWPKYPSISFALPMFPNYIWSIETKKSSLSLSFLVSISLCFNPPSWYFFRFTFNTFYLKNGKVKQRSFSFSNGSKRLFNWSGFAEFCSGLFKSRTKQKKVVISNDRCVHRHFICSMMWWMYRMEMAFPV